MSAAGRERLELAGARIDRCSFAEAVERILERARGGAPPAFVITPNAHHIVLLQKNSALRAAYRAAWLTLADGMSVVWASRLLGASLPGRVSGSDLLPALCREAAGTDLSVFLLGGRPGAAEAAARELQARYPGLRVAGTCCPPFGFERDPAALRRVEQSVRAAAPSLLFVGLGAPKQELWMHRHVSALGVPVAIGVGGTFEFIAGMVRRAPKWVRKAGLEWLFRLGMEPRRLWKRYLLGNPRFVVLVLRELLHRRNTNSPGPAPPVGEGSRAAPTAGAHKGPGAAQ